MSYPTYYDKVDEIELYDPLSEFLGTFDGGKYTITYKEVVKSAGHSCPTVAGAYIMTLVALQALYKDKRAQRGDIEVFFKESVEDGVVGVISNVISHITGATDKSGFKGLNGLHARHSLIYFNSNIEASARFCRKETGVCVDVFYNPKVIIPDQKMQPLMQKILQNTASVDEKKEFGILWQERVEKIFNSITEVVKVEKV